MFQVLMLKTFCTDIYFTIKHIFPSNTHYSNAYKSLYIIYYFIVEKDMHVCINKKTYIYIQYIYYK